MKGTSMNNARITAYAAAIAAGLCAAAAQAATTYEVIAKPLV
jgi:hypothetical protein